MQKYHSKKEISKSNIHIMVLEKFIPNFLRYAFDYLDVTKHIFIIFANEEQCGLFKIPPNIINANNIIIINSANCGKYAKYLYVFKYIIYAKKIFMHGLWMPYINILLFVAFWKLKKCHWLIWGGDLFEYFDKKCTFKAKIFELVRKIIIKRFGFITPVVYGDFIIAQQCYKTKAICKGEIFYMQFYEKFETIQHIKNNKNDKIVIQLGNSATHSMKHKEILRLLEPYNDKIEIILPLSYGDLEYGREIAFLARENFSDVMILEDFISLDEYHNLLSKVDIGIFAMDRQQAMGNIFVLIFLGKKIYLQPGSSHWDFFINKGFKVFDIADFNLEKLPDNLSIYNKNLILKYYSKDKQIENFRFIFDDVQN